MKISQMFKTALPFVFGILIGAGITKNKNVMYILFGYIIFMFIFGLLKDKIMNVKNAENKKDALKYEAMESVKDIGEVTLKGNNIGANLFYKYYGDYIFFFNLALFISLIFLAIYKLWVWALVCFLGLQFHMALNQTVRLTREIKEDIKKIKGE